MSRGIKGYAPSLRESLKLRAYAVLEEGENTGGIVFAKHAVVARRLGANEYADGDFGYIRCNRAPWADAFTDGRVPASLMVEHGWHFECAGCGERVDSDLHHEHGKPIEGIIGHQHSLVFCDAECERNYRTERAEAERRQHGAIARFKRIVSRRFPAAEFMENDDRHIGRMHAYVSRRGDGHWRVGQVAVSFSFPGMKFGPAVLRYEHSYGKRQRPYYACANGDRDAFQRFATPVSDVTSRKDGSSQQNSGRPTHD